MEVSGRHHASATLPPRKNLGFELQTIQPIASCYTDYAIMATKCKSCDKMLQHLSIFNEAKEPKKCF